jgi:hypothetical protein
LISNTLATPERISLIGTIFSDHNQVEMVENLSRDDAQAFIDEIDDVSPHKIPRSKYKAIDFDWNFHILGVG